MQWCIYHQIMLHRIKGRVTLTPVKNSLPLTGGKISSLSSPLPSDRRKTSSLFDARKFFLIDSLDERKNIVNILRQEGNYC